MKMNFNREEFMDFLNQVESELRYGDEFAYDVRNLMNLLDHTDDDDYFGTEGWESYVGWED